MHLKELLFFVNRFTISKDYKLFGKVSVTGVQVSQVSVTGVQVSQVSVTGVKVSQVSVTGVS